jgi:hypothetical protein
MRLQTYKVYLREIVWEWMLTPVGITVPEEAKALPRGMVVSIRGDHTATFDLLVKAAMMKLEMIYQHKIYTVLEPQVKEPRRSKK